MIRGYASTMTLVCLLAITGCTVDSSDSSQPGESLESRIKLSPSEEPPDTRSNSSKEFNLLRQKFSTLLWASYSPASPFDPATIPPVYPGVADILADLETLRRSGFTGLITDRSDSLLAEVPRIARDLGFEGVIAGISDPSDSCEVSKAIASADVIDGYIVGHAGLYIGHYRFEDLLPAVAHIRSVTGKPVSTSEPSDSYVADSNLVQLGDWIAPIFSSHQHGIVDPIAAARWSQEQYDAINSLATERFVFASAVRYPSGGDSVFSEVGQRSYYVLLSAGPHIGAPATFDQQWRSSQSAEAHCGLFTSERIPKLSARPSIILTSVPPIGSFDWLRGATWLASPSDYHIAVYIRVEGSWWTKPYWAHPLTRIGKDGRWRCDITTGGIDQQATEIRAYLLRKTYTPPLAPQKGLPPDPPTHDVLDMASTHRY